MLNGNLIINLKNLIRNINKNLVCKECAQERVLQITVEEGKEQENFVAYVEDYFQLTPSDDQKEIRELHQDSKKQKPHHQTTSFQDLFCMSISDHSNVLASIIEFRYNRKNKRNASETIIPL